MSPADTAGPGEPPDIAIPAGAIVLDGLCDRALEQLVRRAVALVAGCDVASVDGGTDLQLDLGISSLGLVELACVVQEALDLDPENMQVGESLSTVGHVVEQVRTWLARSPRVVSLGDIRAAEAAMVASCGRLPSTPATGEPSPAAPSTGEPSGGDR